MFFVEFLFGTPVLKILQLICEWKGSELNRSLGRVGYLSAVHVQMRYTDKFQKLWEEEVVKSSALKEAWGRKGQVLFKGTLWKSINEMSLVFIILLFQLPAIRVTSQLICANDFKWVSRVYWTRSCFLTWWEACLSVNLQLSCRPCLKQAYSTGSPQNKRCMKGVASNDIIRWWDREGKVFTRFLWRWCKNSLYERPCLNVSIWMIRERKMDAGIKILETRFQI